MPPDGTAIYHADPPALRLCVAAEGMTLLFHRPSGVTHVLLPPSPEILAVLTDGPADIATIISRLEAAHGIDAEEPIAGIVAARLAELGEAGLVAVEPPGAPAEAARG